MEYPNPDESVEPITLIVPDFIVEWQDGDLLDETYTNDFYNDLEQNPNSFQPILKIQRRKRKLHIATAGIFISICLLLGFLWYETYSSKNTYYAIDSEALKNIYSFYFIEDNGLTFLSIDQDVNVIFSQNITYGWKPYQYLVPNQKIYWYLTEKNELYFLTSKKNHMIANNVTNFIPSRDGLKVFYVIEQDKEYSLYEYNLAKGSSVLIDNNVIANEFCVSPDSNIIAYQKLSATKNIAETYFYTQGNKQWQGNDIIPIALSNEGKLFYYVKNQNLYVQSNRGISHLTIINDKNLSDLELVFNQDYSELQYKYNEKLYQSINGGGGVMLHSYEKFVYTSFLEKGVYFNNDSQIVSLNIPHLDISDSFDMSYKYREWFEKRENIMNIIVYDNKLFCLADNVVYYMESQGFQSDKVKIISRNLSIKQLIYSTEHNLGYMLTEEGDLYQLDKNGNIKWCLDYVTGIYQNYWQGEEEFYFTRTDPYRLSLSSLQYNYELCYRNKDNTIESVDGADNVTILGYSNQLLYKKVTDPSNQYYIVKNGKGIMVNNLVISDEE